MDSLDELEPNLRVAVIVAHPDDETLWAGGLLLSHPHWSIFVASLCRGNDPDRSPRFFQALERLGARGAMGDLDDGPGQDPLDPGHVKATLLALMPERNYDLLLTHGPDGEYTWHRRHVETSQAVLQLWREGELEAGTLWRFAYEDGGGACYPRPREDAQVLLPLQVTDWAAKYALVTEVYGFLPTSWEAKAAPRTEAFQCSSSQEWQIP